MVPGCCPDPLGPITVDEVANEKLPVTVPAGANVPFKYIEMDVGAIEVVINCGVLIASDRDALYTEPTPCLFTNMLPVFSKIFREFVLEPPSKSVGAVPGTVNTIKEVSVFELIL